MKVFKTILALVLLAAVVAIGVWSYPRVAARFTWVAIASVHLSPGMRIEEGMAILRLWPVASVPEGAMHSLADVIGKYAVSRKYKDDVLTPSDLTARTPRPRTPRPGHTFAIWPTHREDLAKIHVGDVVDAILTRTSPKGAKYDEVFTISPDWVVAKIEYIASDPAKRMPGAGVIYLEMTWAERVALNPVTSRGFVIPVRIARRESSR